jgi:hypothetical protein
MKKQIGKRWFCNCKEQSKRMVAAVVAVSLLASSLPVSVYADAPEQPNQSEPIAKSAVRPVEHNRHTTPQTPSTQPTDSIATEANRLNGIGEEQADNGVKTVDADSIAIDLSNADFFEDVPMLTAGEALEADSLAVVAAMPKSDDEWVPRNVEFNPDPTKAVWYAALFPGLGQVYNRRYWKLPLIVGGYLGLAYATSWNNSMLTDYTKAYSDLLDNDPTTKSYMDLFAPNVSEESISKTWLQNIIKSRKNYFRRNRDLCIISMVGVYLLAMLDAYVDASLSHFDISPDLSMDLAPAVMQDGRQRYPSVGLVWALNF